MRVIGNWLFLIAMSFWIGTSMFLTFILIPRLRSQFSQDELYGIVSALLPLQFQLGMVVGMIVVIIAIVRMIRADRPKRLLRWAGVLLIAMLALNIVGEYYFMPQMMELEPDGSPQFIHLFNFLQAINLLILLLGLLALLLIAADMRLLPGKPTRSGYSFHYGGFV